MSERGVVDDCGRVAPNGGGTLNGGDELMMTIAEQWVQEGRWEGCQEGLNFERHLLSSRQVRRWFDPMAMERRQALLEQIGKPAVLGELEVVLLDCADGAAWLAALARRVTA